MSTAEASVAAAPRHRNTGRLFASELRLVFGRRRNQVGMAVLLAIVVMLGLALKATQLRHPGGRGGDIISSVVGNGIFLGFAGLTIEITLFLPLAVSVLAGDAVAGEANLGTLRYLLVAPVSRLRLLAVKACALAVGAFTGASVVAVGGVVAGTLLFGAGPLTTLSGVRIAPTDGLLRLLLATGYVAVGLTALAMIGLFVSTLTEQPIAATVATAMLAALLWVLDAVPQLDWLHPWLLVDRWPSLIDLLREPVFTDRIVAGLWVDAAYGVVFFVAAWLRFRVKDVTS